MICDTPQSYDVFANQIWNSYLKEYRRYAQDSMQVLETRSEVKVTATQVRYATLCHPKMHPHTKFGIYKRYPPDTIIFKTRLEVKVNMTRKLYATLRHLKIHLHTKFGTGGRTDTKDGQCDYCMPPKVPLGDL